MKLNRKSFFSLLASIFITGCGDNDNQAQSLLERKQFARVSILNAFSATDSAIRSAAFNDQIVDSINDDQGGGLNESQIERMRGWSIHLKPGTTPEQRASLLDFLRSLSSAYDDLNSVKYDHIADFSFSYKVSEHDERIDVRATGRFGIE